MLVKVGARNRRSWLAAVNGTFADVVLPHCSGKETAMRGCMAVVENGGSVQAGAVLPRVANGWCRLTTAITAAPLIQ